MDIERQIIITSESDYINSEDQISYNDIKKYHQKIKKIRRRQEDRISTCKDIITAIITFTI